MFDSVLVVCAGNICRSPTGEYLLKAKLEGKNITVSSAGLTALEGKSADATAKKIAQAHGINIGPTPRAPTYFTINCTEQCYFSHGAASFGNDLHSQYPEARGKTFLLGKWIDNTEIPDS